MTMSDARARELADRLVQHFRVIGIPEDDTRFRDYLAAALIAYAEQSENHGPRA